MPIEAKVLTREFVYQGTKLADPNPQLNPDQVRDVLTSAHPELANAAVDGPEVNDGKHVYTFVRSAGTKG